MPLGVKTRIVEFKNTYTLESLFEAIKDKDFTAGKAEFSKQGLAHIITFPALDRKNQLWLMKKGMGKSGNRFTVSKQEQVGMANSLANSFTRGGVVGGMIEASSDNFKRCEELVDITADELAALGI